MKLFGKRTDIAFLVFLAMFSVLQQGRGKLRAPFWDYHVYVDALARLHAGANPYAAQALPFVYPPLFLNLFGHAPFASVYALFAAAALGCALWGIGRSPVWLVAALGFLTGGAGVGGIVTGNFAIFAHVLLVALFYAASRDEGLGTDASRALAWLIALLIVVFASIKIYFFAYAFVFLFLPKATRYLLLAAAGVALAGVAQVVFEPQQWAAFEAMLRLQMLVRNDAGLVLPGLLQRHLHALPPFVDVLVHVTIVTALFVYAINPLRAPRAIAFGDVSGKLFYLLAFAIVLNPRLKEYDLGPFFACCFASLFLNRHGDTPRERAFFFAVPAAFIAAWIVVVLTRWFFVLDGAWVLGVYLVFALASLRQRAQRAPAMLAAEPRGTRDADLTVTP
ncbi:hypothetical protein [Paraburkholderia acidisoli]|uniref:Uncharacterized protein n=1 Tax=Paraburkholderia acidisoli TaxID=2571748 RepID=A0A7Z2GEN9_9BURK|nr:hypothetical protein [Paraburkholderia acidisoli]QGZ60268.1 hypothetical protein FAZ98_00125 [Paraburkholderia acidisoli]